MQATVQKPDLLRAIQTAERAVCTKSSLPILSALMLEVSGETLFVKATDLELSIQTSTQVLAGQDGAAAVPGKQFVEFVKAMPGQEVSLSVSDGTMLVRSGKSRYKLQIIGNRDEFPLVPEVKREAGFITTEKALAEVLGRTVIAAADEDTRPLLCSVLWKLKEGAKSLPMVATDTHRLHMAACPIHSASGTMDVLVSARACRELARLLSGDQDCQVTIDGNQIQVITAAGTLVGRRLEGRYPAYEKVVPSYNDHVGLNRDDLTEVLNRIGIVARDASGRAFLEFADGQPLKVTADAGDQGQAEEEVALDGFLNDGQAPKIAANWRFLLQAAQACPEEGLHFYHQAKDRPILLHGGKRDQFFAVVMPMSAA